MFLNGRHEVRYDELLTRDGAKADIEREALFFILAGTDDLYKKADKVYDFQDRSIRPECLDGNVDLSSGSRALVLLGFDLFNSFNGASVSDVFSPLDEENRSLAFEAIKLRFRVR